MCSGQRPSGSTALTALHVTRLDPTSGLHVVQVNDNRRVQDLVDLYHWTLIGRLDLHTALVFGAVDVSADG